MANNPNRKPKVGDRVSVTGVNGAYEVVALKREPDMATLKLLGKADYTIDVPWGVLTFLDQEDASQAAARVVREATKDH
jgi:hypothetical protein